MPELYSFTNDKISKLIKMASNTSGATLVIPDLQRPFVWDPPDVILLVDSLLRGWPFGTLLLWDVDDRINSTIPSLGFRRVVDTYDGKEDRMNEVGNGKPFKMVLDGQQRIQSLLLAFGGDGWGYRLGDNEWAECLRKQGMKDAKGSATRWSLGQLCVNLKLLERELEDRQHLRFVNYKSVLVWAVMDSQKHQSHSNCPTRYQSPLVVQEKQTPGHIVRLADLYRIADDNPSSTSSELREQIKLKMFCGKFPISLKPETLENVTELVSILKDFAQMEIYYLNVRAIVLNDDRCKYNNAVINIFTRLNTAGRTLTPEEVVFAWIKLGWAEAKVNQTALSAFENLLEELKKSGFPVLMDDLVALVVAAWAVYHNDGIPLSYEDLADGEKTKKMTKEVSDQWPLFENVFPEMATLLHSSDYWDVRMNAHYKSKNSVYVLLCWMLVARNWLEESNLSETERSACLAKSNRLFLEYAVRYLMITQWANEWSDDTSFTGYLKDLAIDRNSVQNCDKCDKVLGVLETRMKLWLKSLSSNAESGIDSCVVTKRNQVTNYQPYLWVWHRLDDERWRVSAAPLRLEEVTAQKSKKAISPTLVPEVDHCVSHNSWEIRVKHESADDEHADFMQRERMEVINHLGNCTLLAKGFNISKSRESFSDFFPKIQDVCTGGLKQEVFMRALLFREQMFNPSAYSMESVVKAIDDRTADMKKELKEYVRGERDLVDEAKPKTLRNTFA